MLFAAMIALFAATAPAQEDVEQLENQQEIVLSDECDSLVMEEECLDEQDQIVLDDVCEDMVDEDSVAFSEE